MRIFSLFIFCLCIFISSCTKVIDISVNYSDDINKKLITKTDLFIVAGNDNVSENVLELPSDSFITMEEYREGKINYGFFKDESIIGLIKTGTVLKILAVKEIDKPASSLPYIIVEDMSNKNQYGVIGGYLFLDEEGKKLDFNDYYLTLMK